MDDQALAMPNCLCIVVSPLRQTYLISCVHVQDLSPILKTLLDQNHVFYLKHGYPSKVSDVGEMYCAKLARSED